MKMYTLEIVDFRRLTQELVAERHRIIRALWWGDVWPWTLEREKNYPESARRQGIRHGHTFQALSIR